MWDAHRQCVLIGSYGAIGTLSGEAVGGAGPTMVGTLSGKRDANGTPIMRGDPRGQPSQVSLTNATWNHIKKMWRAADGSILTLDSWCGPESRVYALRRIGV